ncbi:MAG: M3 family metallopeptidase [Tannerella sp.]|jgi:peptidyl-dipeptidase Dcp|nr:M3 family metallopeptidase [Tannerella sp.]
MHESLSTNPFFGKYTTEHQTIPFDKIRDEHYLPAFDEGFRLLREDIDRIAGDTRTPTFENTILELERSGEFLKSVSDAFFGIFSAVSDEKKIEIAQTVSPKISESSHYIFLNKPLFKRVKEVYENKASLNLSTEDLRLLENTYDHFIDSGADLNEADRESYKRLSTELTLLAIDFDKNVIKDENSFELLITDRKDLNGLPSGICRAAEAAAGEKGQQGWLFTLSEPSYVPFMRYSGCRELRKKMYMAKSTVGSRGNESDNREIVKKTVNNRLETAHLLGYDNYASYVLKDKMAKDAANVYKLFRRLLKSYKPLAENEYKTLNRFASETEDDRDFILMPWDWDYYAERLKKRLFHVNDEITRPYFELKSVTKGVFGLAGELYGLTFRENAGIPVYHKDVTAYEVLDSDDSLLGILYADFFSRETKQPGAWMSSLKGQFIDGENNDRRPHILISMNFMRPTNEQPSLLSYGEVKTLLHEFGHALHGLMSKCRYGSMSGTNVKHDFVELPSQIMENWLDETGFLDRIGVHYRTGRKIPRQLTKNIINSANFNAGYACCRQVGFGLLDMAWHTLTVPFDGNIARFEKKAWKKTLVLPGINRAIMSCRFGHIFSGGYAAGYYGYKWAEVLDADAFSAFKEKGVFDRETAQSFRQNILSKGDSEDPNVLYASFRGRKPSIDALLRRNGILPATVKRGAISPAAGVRPAK